MSVQSLKRYAPCINANNFYTHDMEGTAYATVDNHIDQHASILFTAHMYYHKTIDTYGSDQNKHDEAINGFFAKLDKEQHGSFQVVSTSIATSVEHGAIRGFVTSITYWIG